MFREKISGMAPGKRRRFLRFLAFLFVGLLILLIALPLWFPWLLKPAAKAFGAGYDKYEREGYTRFRVSGVTFTNKAAIVHAGDIAAFVPTAWLWRMVASSKAEPFARVSSWEYIDRPRVGRVPSVSTNFIKLNKTLTPLKRWIPNATLTNGTVRASKVVLTIPAATWVKGNLAADVALPKNLATVLRASFTPDAPLKIWVDSQALELRSEISAVAVAGVLQLEGTAFWMSNRVAVAAGFPRVGLLPDTGSVRADAFEIPASRLRLEGYDILTGSWRLEWSTNHFTMDLTGKAVPLQAGMPTVNIDARAFGDTNAVRIDTFHVQAPGLKAELTEGTLIQFSPPFLVRPTALTVSADLKEQPWVPAGGILQGSAMLTPGKGTYPHIAFTLAGSNMTISNLLAGRWEGAATNRELNVSTLRLEGEFDWPDLKLSQARIGLPDGSEAILTTVLNLRQKTITDGELNYSGAFGREFLPPGYSFERVSLKARFSGPLTNVSHSATIEASRLRFPRSAPMHLDADLQGHRTEWEQASVLLTAGKSSLQMRGSVKAGGDTNELTMAEMTFRAGTNELRLEQPFRLLVDKPAGQEITTTNRWEVRLERARWTGDDRELSLEGNVLWPGQGSFHAAARGLKGSWLKEFVQLPGTNATLNQLVVAGGWTNGPVAFELELDAGLEVRDQLSFSAQANMVGGKNGISIEHCSIFSATQVVCSVYGNVPIFLEPGRTNGLFHINPDSPLTVTAATEPNSVLWDAISDLGGLQLRKPKLSMNVEGTWAAPRGRITVGAERVQYTRAGTQLPAMQDLEFDLELDRQSARLSRFKATIEGQPVYVKGQVPLGENFWAGLRRGKYLPDWREGTGELKMEDAQLAKFGKFTPDFLTPQGTATIDVRLERGRQLHGEIAFRDAKTYPVATFGPVRNIEGKALFTGSEIRLVNLSGEIGGQLVTVTGNAQLNDKFWQEKKLPPFQVHVYGTNVPLVRKPEVVVRADLDLSMTNSAAGEGIVAGHVRLRDSFFLSDLESLVPSGVAGPKLRPPYFSIEAEPWAHWRVDVTVEGPQFLRVRGPLFRGVISATFRTEGTLRDPMAIGEARVASGAVTFPFGALTVKQGFVSLSSDDPHRLKIYLVATAQRMNYDVRMTVSGVADEPVIQFSSTPSLSSEQIVLMLTTGQVPQGATAMTTSTQRRAQGLALFVGKNFLSELGFGGAAGEERLTFRSGDQVTLSGRPTYTVEYKLTDYLTLVGEYDRFSQYNIDLKWRVYHR